MLPTFSICNLRLVVTFLSCVFKSNTFHLHDHLVTSVSKREMKKQKLSSCAVRLVTFLCERKKVTIEKTK
jgi:hypothetical protein